MTLPGRVENGRPLPAAVAAKFFPNDGGLDEGLAERQDPAKRVSAAEGMKILLDLMRECETEKIVPVDPQLSGIVFKRGEDGKINWQWVDGGGLIEKEHTRRTYEYTFEGMQAAVKSLAGVPATSSNAELNEVEQENKLAQQARTSLGRVVETRGLEPEQKLVHADWSALLVEPGFGAWVETLSKKDISKIYSGIRDGSMDAVELAKMIDGVKQ
jgi:hypothetical protein